MTSRKIAITGATGFIGKRLLHRCLDKGWDIRVLSRFPDRFSDLRNKIQIFKEDLTDPSSILEGFVEGREIIFHCAGEIKDETKMAALHVGGSQRLIEAAAGHSVHWIQLSSVGAYGRHQAGIVNESTKLSPAGTYEMTKARSDELVIEAGQKGAFEFTILRPSTVYGQEMPNDSLRGLIRMIQRRLFFHIGSRGSQAIYIHVDDVVTALLTAAEKKEARNRIYNVSDQISFDDFVDLVCRLSKIPTIKVRLPESLVRIASLAGAFLPGFPLSKSRIDALTTRVRYDTSRIEKELNFHPKITPTLGLGEMISSMRETKRHTVQELSQVDAL